MKFYLFTVWMWIMGLDYVYWVGLMIDWMFF
jgi:hypothetical protein